MSEDGKAWLDRVYGAKSTAELAEAYDAWAESYDDDVMAFGYLHPAVMAGMAARHLDPDAGPILDAGAGTGLVGALLAPLGYRPIVAIDLSMGMLAAARKRGVYAELHQMVLGVQLAFADDQFAAVVAAGVFTHGHAPAEAFDELIRVVRPAGFVFLALSDRARAELGFGDKVEALTAAGAWRLHDQTEPFAAMPNAGSLGTHPARIYAYQVLS